MAPKNNADINFWNRKLHIYAGLSLLFFIWLFSLSGLILNHGDWEFASFWDTREEKKTISIITIESHLDSAALIHNIIQQLALAGEVSEVKISQANLDFRISSPGMIRELHVDFQSKTAEEKELRYNFWGKIRTLHTFNGSNKNHPERSPNWMATRIWRLAMDVIAFGFVLLCMSSWIMWYKVRKQFRGGTLVLIAGFATAVYFLYLLKML